MIRGRFTPTRDTEPWTDEWGDAPTTGGRRTRPIAAQAPAVVY